MEGFDSSMAQYAVAFDLDTKAMRNDGLSESEKTSIYQREISDALSSCGFTAHPQGSLYHTEKDQDPIKAIMNLQTTLKTKAPQLCKYVNRIHIFRMEEWSDVTDIIANKPAAPSPTGDEEYEEDELTSKAG